MCESIVLFVRYISAGQQNQVHMHDSINNLPTAPQPGEFTINTKFNFII